MDDLKGKKVLFFAPAFFGYETKIADEMRKLGAIVDAYDSRSIKGSFERAIIKLWPGAFKKKTNKYYASILNDLPHENYDYIFFVKCDMTPISVLEILKSMNPSAVFCLYLWDSVQNIPGIQNKFCYFDRVLSFDPKDCKKYKEMGFRPLFFDNDFRNNNVQKKYEYDISFCGTVHTDRLYIINKIAQQCRDNDLKMYTFCYLQSTFIYWLYFFTKKEFRSVKKSFFSFEKKSGAEIADIINKTKAVLDVQAPSQTGLTMRTIEMIGMNKKLITTNQTIKEYDFYTPENICIIDRHNPILQEEFLRTEFKPIDETVYEKYSLKSWIFDILGIGNEK